MEGRSAAMLGTAAARVAKHRLVLSAQSVAPASATKGGWPGIARRFAAPASAASSLPAPGPAVRERLRRQAAKGSGAVRFEAAFDEGEAVPPLASAAADGSRKRGGLPRPLARGSAAAAELDVHVSVAGGAWQALGGNGTGVADRSAAGAAAAGAAELKLLGEAAESALPVARGDLEEKAVRFGGPNELARAGAGTPVDGLAEGSAEAALSTLSRAERREIAAERRVEALRADPAALSMPPGRLAMQQDLLAARSTGRLLALCTEGEVQSMDAVNLATAVHRLAKLSAGDERTSAVANVRFDALLGALETRLEELRPQGLANVLWALVRLEASPSWLPRLLSLCHERRGQFSVRDLSAALACLARAPALHACDEADTLKEGAVLELRKRIGEVSTPTDLVCVGAALARLEVRDEAIFAGIAERAQLVLHEFEPADITTLVWAFASLQLLHGGLFDRVRAVLEHQIERCGTRELVQTSWAFSRVRRADARLLSGTFAPAIRAKLLEFEGPRDLCTVAWAFSNATVVDKALLNDVAHALSAKVKQMNAHDVSSIVVALSSIEYNHRRLFKALQKHTRTIIHSFSPLQLARTTYGFGLAGVEDESLFRLLCQQVVRKRHLLHARNIVEVLVGLAEAEYLPPKEVAELLGDDVGAIVPYLGAKDVVHALHALSRMEPASRSGRGRSSGPGATIEAAIGRLLGELQERAQGRFKLDAAAAADLLEVLPALGRRDDVLVGAICRQLPRFLLLRGASSCEDAEFLRLWGALAELSGGERGVVKEHLHRHGRLREPLEARLAGAAASFGLGGAGAGSGDEGEQDLRAGALLAYACARLGYDGPAASELLLSLLVALDSVTSPRARLEALEEPWMSPLLWALAELGVEDARADALLQDFLKVHVEGAPTEGAAAVRELGGNALLHLAWCCAVRQVSPPQALVAQLSAAFPAGTQRREASVKQAGAVENEDQEPMLRAVGLAFGDAPAPLQGHSGRRSPQRPGAASRPVVEALLSEALIRLRVPHEAPYTVAATHCLAIGFPQRQLVLDLLGPADLGTSTKRPLGATRLRAAQLEELGWKREVCHGPMGSVMALVFARA
eukprot:TRINITY_DN16969_c0_g1_i4.p1 TRINITY_DN16969_c0_g1~~TRINITY_DN16969_c0_g1_i4.p1  ORF type:complete len:1111 (-),score=278.40 TRINITY_DN16969_c0_g1_i4:165-3431(-)